MLKLENAVLVVWAVALMHGVAQAANFSTVLRNDYYDQTCPQLESTVARTSWYKYNNSAVVAAGVLRIYFHDCWVAVRSRILLADVFHVSARPMIPEH